MNEKCRLGERKNVEGKRDYRVYRDDEIASRIVGIIVSS